MNIDRLLVGRSARSEQRIDECRESISFADDDVRVLAQLILVELTLEQLRGAADAAERVLDLDTWQSTTRSTG